MPKWLPISKLLQLRISTCTIFLLCLIAIIQFFASYGRYNYDSIPREHLMENIYFHTSPKYKPNKEKPDCKYDGILQNTSSIDSWDAPKKYDNFSASGIADGTYSPENCNALLSVALIITYRNRQRQLDVFIPYIHNFLRKQGIHYSIYVIEQQDDKPFNRGALLNIGAKQAIIDRYPCLILHDVDLLPLDFGNLYACLRQPRHMSASIDKFRYVLLYDHLVGGALAIRTDQYISLNGFSNRFQGWGGEDDDFAERITTEKLRVLRFPQKLSRYTMMVHRQEQKNKDRGRTMLANRINRHRDGLFSIENGSVIKSFKRNRLFTLIDVKL